MKSKWIRLLVIVSGLVGSLLLFQSLYFHVQVILLNSPQEYRETATILPTELLQRSKIPYTPQTMPVYANMYGIFYNAVMVPVTNVFGTAYGVFRAVNGLFIFLCLGMLFMVFQKKKISVSVALLMIVIWYAQILQSNFDILGRPEGLGEFLFLASVVVPWMFRFSKKSLAASIVLSILAFYTKPYFALGGILVGLYLCLGKSVRSGIGYLAGLAMAFGAIAVITQATMEFYFYNTVLFHLKNARYFVSYVILQTKVFALNNAGLLAIVVVHPMLSKRRRLKLREVDYFLFMLAATTIAVLGKFGGHDGNYLSYYTQLIGPFLLIVAVTYIEKYKNTILIWLCVLFNLGVLLFFSITQNVIPVRAIETNWKEWTVILDSYEDIYNAPPFSKYLYDTGKPVYDAGHTEYFTKAISKFNFFLFNDARTVYNDHLHEIDRKIQSREFDLIILFHDYVYYDFLYTGYLHYFIEQNYTLKEIKPLLMYHDQKLLFELWVKK